MNVLGCGEMPDQVTAIVDGKQLSFECGCDEMLLRESARDQPDSSLGDKRPARGSRFAVIELRAVSEPREEHVASVSGRGQITHIGPELFGPDGIAAKSVPADETVIGGGQHVSRSGEELEVPQWSHCLEPAVLFVL